VRPHLASLVEDFLARATETAVVAHRGVRRYTATYGELAQLSGRFAAELERRNIGPGDRVVLWGANSAEWIGAFFGCLLRGVLAVPLDATGSIEFAQRILGEVTPRLILGDAALLLRLSTELPTLVLSEMAEALPLAANFSVAPSVTEETPFQIVFTSGTTAEPKGIVHTHRNVLASLRPIESEMAKYRRYERWVHPLRFLHTLPLSHIFGQFMGLWTPALLAAELHFTDQLESARIVDLTRRERISVLIAVPRVLGLLRSHLLQRFPALAAGLEEAASLSALKRWWRFRAVHRSLGWKFWAVISGGASLPADLERFWNRLGFALIQGYGMTETAALVTLNHPFRIGQGTIGKALPGREVRLSESGEILVRGDMVSAATWQYGGMQPRNGEWLATGDIAERSDSGDFRFLGRKGDVIVTSSGLNIYPSDIESAMLRQPGVRGCAVVPCESSNGVDPVCVVLFPGDDAALQRAVALANGSLTEYQQVRRVLRWPEVDFPYTSTGKLLRRRIRDWACATFADRTASPDSGKDALLALIAEITGVQGAPGGDELRLSEDLYLDSLGRVQLAAAIEQRMGIELGEDETARIVTLGDLREALGVRDSSTPSPADGPSIPAPTHPEAPAASPHAYPHWPWSRPVQTLRSAVLETVARPLIALFLKPTVVPGPQAMPEGPLLLIANHVTMLDGPLVLYALPGRLRRRVAIAMSGEILLDLRRGRGQKSFLGDILAPAGYWLVTALFNVFPLPRLRGFKRSFAHAGEALDRGYSVMVFPEGTRSHGKPMAHFRSGIGVLAANSRVPVLPVALVGMDKLLDDKNHWNRRGRIEIRIGKAITLPEEASAAEWTERLESAMRDLMS
jgi:long-chain acyl-CoA synthetase